MDLSELIKKYRADHKMTQQEFADRAGLSKGFISQLENDYRPNKDKRKMIPSVEAYRKLAVGMGMDLNDLLNSVSGEISLTGKTLNEENTAINITNIPCYAELCCGNGMFVDDNILDYVAVPSEWLSPRKEYFAQKAKGDSMTGANINDGDILIFEKSDIVDQGKIGCFCVDENMAVCKKYTEHAGMIYLLPMNDKYEPIIIDPSNECFRCIGKLDFVLSDRREK